MSIRKPIPDGITEEHLIAAIGEVTAGNLFGFGPSIDYDLIYEGERYPPKAVVGIATKYLLGAPLKPKHFSSGLGSRCFKILESNGFTIIAKEDVGLYPDELPKDFYEGSAKRVSVNRYERDPKARAICIEYYGTICSCCRVDLGQVYGEIGDGFIHVHHLTPIADIGERISVDPIKDLRPVCPNCHAMLHRQQPPYSVEELRLVLAKQRS